MRKSWVVVAMVLSLVSSGWTTAQAGDDWDAQVSRQCPHMAAWIRAKDIEAAAHQKTQPLGKPSEPELRAELLKMSDADQKARNAVIADGFKHAGPIKAMWAVDAGNLPHLKRMVAAQGIPTVAQVGKDGVEAALLLVQHADRDPGFQMKVLDQLQASPDHGGVSAQQFTLLTDRVLVAQHKPQRYGTQFTMKDGKLKADPMEDPANVDKRRVAAGLPPLADYACMLGIDYRAQGKP